MAAHGAAAVPARRALDVRRNALPDLRTVSVAGFLTRRRNLIRDLGRAIAPMHAHEQLREPAALKR
jgi:hypothetical protein